MNRTFSNIIPSVITIVSIWIVLLIPFQVVGHGFLPPDDAMRHSAKVISGKDWNQILVLRDEIKMDSYPGWHAILGLTQKITGFDQHGLVLFSAVSLFLLFCLIPIFFLKFKESWLAALLVLSLAVPAWMTRLLLGRPYIVTMAALLVILFMAPRLKEKKLQYINTLILTAIVSITVWIHASWYFFLLMVVVFLLSRQWRAAAIMAVSSILGIFIGASLTGHPIIFIRQMITHLFLVFGSHSLERQLVGELRPMVGDYRIVLTAMLMLVWRALRGKGIKNSVDSPAFILAGMSFILGLITTRIWLDWGMTAFAVWVAKEIDDFLDSKIDISSFKRIIIALIIGATLCISITVDASSRWSMARPLDYISSEDSKQAKLLPPPGGIIYSDDMFVFYQIFYKNPKADWRYILGFESAFMPPEDLKILRKIQENLSRPEDYEPWVDKMGPKDRLVIRGSPDAKPKIKGLEWNYIALNTWIGRKLP